MNKRLFIIAGILCLIQVSPLSAQTKHRLLGVPVESNVTVGSGIFFEKGEDTDDPGLATSLSYGLDFTLGKGWSVMPEIGFRDMRADVFTQGYDGDWCSDYFFACEISANVRHHFDLGNGRQVILGLAPVYSLAIDRDYYSFDYDGGWNNPIDGEPIIKKNLFSVKPSLQYQISKHWYLGLEAMFEIGNAAVRYPSISYDNSKRLNSITETVSYHF